MGDVNISQDQTLNPIYINPKNASVRGFQLEISSFKSKISYLGLAKWLSEQRPLQPEPGVLVCYFSVAVIEYADRKQLCEERVHFDLQFQSQSIVVGKVWQQGCEAD